MRLSNKDLLLLFGIVIAVIITLTTLVYTDWTVQGTSHSSVKPNTALDSSSQLIQRAIERIKIDPLVR